MNSKISAAALLGLGVMMAMPGAVAAYGGEPSHHEALHHRAPPMLLHYATPSSVYLSPAEVVPAVPASPAFKDADGRLCREYRLTVTVDDAKRPTYGTACQQVDGTWRIVGHLETR